MAQPNDDMFGSYAEQASPLTLGEFFTRIGQAGRGISGGLVRAPYTIAKGVDDIMDNVTGVDPDSDAYAVQGLNILNRLGNYMAGDSEQAQVAAELIGENLLFPGAVKGGVGAAKGAVEYLGPNLVTEELMRAGVDQGDADLAGIALSALLGTGRRAGPPDTMDVIQNRTIGDFDPRFDPRKLEADRISETTVKVDDRGVDSNVPEIKLDDLEGRPFIMTMSDRTAAGGDLLGINGVEFAQPVSMRGGQGFMLEDPDKVWASAPGPVNQILSLASDLKKETGLNPVLMPWRMAPTGGDFSSMTGRTGLAYAQASMNKRQKNSLNKMIKGFIPDWKGVDDPASLDQFTNAPDAVRKAIKGRMDVDFRNDGGLNIGQMRTAVTDPGQLTAAQGLLQNVGEIDVDRAARGQLSTHPDYPNAVAGQGLGRLPEQDQIQATLAKQEGWSDKEGNWRSLKGDPLNPHHSDLRSLQFKPVGGVMTERRLRGIYDLLGR